MLMSHLHGSVESVKKRSLGEVQINSSLYLRYYAEACTTGGDYHVRDLAPGQHSSQETSRRWRAEGECDKSKM